MPDQTSASCPPRPAGIEYAAGSFLLLTCLAICLTRVSATDTPYHLATARWAWANGRWPVHNTFSYTYPDNTLFQQYPIYQALLYAVYRVGSWPGLSLLHCGVWLTVLLLWMAWGGGWRWVCLANAAWLVGLLGLQRRALLRPDMLTLLWLACLLLAVERYRAGRRGAAFFFVLLQFLMANTHQMFTLGLAVQGLFLGHLVVARLAAGRAGMAPEEAKLPVAPAALALIGSILVCFLTPLGLGILGVPRVTADSLVSHRQHIDEFMPLYRAPYEAGLVALAAVLGGIGWWTNRRRWLPFEVGLWLLAAVLACSAVRGTVFFVLISVGLFARGRQRRWALNPRPRGMNPAPPSSVPEESMGLLRIAGTAATLGMCLFLIYIRWVHPERRPEGVQPGIGRNLGNWPDQAIHFLKENPPPGRMMNLSWYSGNALIWGLYPEQPVFVDPRFETYPRSFLQDVIAAEEDLAVFERLVRDHDPSWLVAEIRLPALRRQVARLVRERGWELVYADTIFVVLVRGVPATAAYRAAHRLEPRDMAPLDFLIHEPDLYGIQLLRVASLFQEFGLLDRAEQLAERAEPLAGRFSTVQEEWARFRTDFPVLKSK